MTLKSICKYHLFKKRDGSIVNQILTDSGEITSDPEEVSSLLIEVLKDIQLSEKFEQYTGSMPFPDLPQLSKEQIGEILSSLSSGKALRSFLRFSVEG